MLGHIKRKAAHRNKEKQKLTYHIVVYSISGAPRSIQSAAFTIERGDHAFESTTAAQARALSWRCRGALRLRRCGSAARGVAYAAPRAARGGLRRGAALGSSRR